MPLIPALGGQTQMDLRLRPAWSMQRIPGQPGLCGETPSQKKQPTNQLKICFPFLFSFFFLGGGSMYIVRFCVYVLVYTVVGEKGQAGETVFHNMDAKN